MKEKYKILKSFLSKKGLYFHEGDVIYVGKENETLGKDIRLEIPRLLKKGFIGIMKEEKEKDDTGLKFWPWENGKEPYFTCEKDQLEWYIDDDSTKYAHSKDLKNIFVFILRDMKTKQATERVIMKSDPEEVIYTSTKLDDIGCFIDKLKIIKTFK